MSKALKPFWIYWGVLLAGCILSFIFPLILFIFFSVMLIILPFWFAVVYLIGAAVQHRSMLCRRSHRIFLSFLCSLFIVLIFPVCSWINDIIQWNTFHIRSFINCFNDLTLWILFAVHSVAFWIGEETEHTGFYQTKDGET